MTSQNVPMSSQKSLDTLLKMDLNPENSVGGSNQEPSEYDCCDFCINCNTVLLQESCKISKIFRFVQAAQPTTETDDHQQHNNVKDGDTKLKKTEKEVGLISAISLTFSVGDILMEHFTEKHIMCEKCGKLLELAYNAILDFMELTRRGSALQEKLIKTKASLSSSPSAVKKSRKVAPESKRMSLSKKNNELVTSKRSQRLIRSTGKNGSSQEADNPTRSSKRSRDEPMDDDDKAKSKRNCSLCGKPFISDALLFKHKRLFHSNGDDKSHTRKSLRHHGSQSGDESKSVGGVLTDTTATPTDLSVSVFYCTICDVECDNVDKFQNHLKLHEEDGEEVENDNNGSSYQVTTTMAEEDNDYEDEDGADCDLSLEKLKCKLCGEEGNNSVSELKDHYSKQHPLVSILTVNEMHNIEKDSFKAEELNDHEDADEEKSKILGLKTGGGSNGRFIFNCNVCQKRFIRHDHIKLHLRIHTGEKPFVCNVEGCGKTFSDPRGLAYHEITHSNERPYCCKFCGMTFKRLHHLNDHERNHNDVPRRFACQFCNKAFKHRKHLNSHLIIHQGTKEHQCDLCFKSFNRKDNLRQHVRKVHGKQSSADSATDGKSPPTKETSKNEKSSVLKLVEAEGVSGGLQTSSTQTVVFHTPSGAITTGTIITSSNNASSIIGGDINAQTASSSAVVMPTAAAASATVKGSLNSSPTTTTIPVAIAITDQAAIDQIVYMHL